MQLKESVDLSEFMRAVRQCREDVFYESENANIDLKSELSRFVFAMLLQDHASHASGTIFCTDAADYERLQAFLEPGCGRRA